MDECLMCSPSMKISIFMREAELQETGTDAMLRSTVGRHRIKMTRLMRSALLISFSHGTVPWVTWWKIGSHSCIHSITKQVKGRKASFRSCCEGSWRLSWKALNMCINYVSDLIVLDFTVALFYCNSPQSCCPVWRLNVLQFGQNWAALLLWEILLPYKTSPLLLIKAK